MIFMPSFMKILQIVQKLLGGKGPRTSHYKTYTELVAELSMRKLHSFCPSSWATEIGTSSRIDKFAS
jgi:hypothetical protein